MADRLELGATPTVSHVTAHMTLLPFFREKLKRQAQKRKSRWDTPSPSSLATPPPPNFATPTYHPPTTGQANNQKGFKFGKRQKKSKRGKGGK